MRVLVVGGTGALGTAVVARAAAAGHEVTAVSRRAPARLPAGVRHRVADVSSGDGLTAALAGAEVVVDATNGVREPGRVLVDGTRRVLAEARAVGVRHFVGISIVGIDDAPVPYYRVKVEQERVIESGEVPWSLLRATQFHDLVARLANGKLGVVLAPRGFALQPIDTRDVAAVMLGAAEAAPAGRLPDVAGPEVCAFRDLARAWARAARRTRVIVPVPLPGARGRFFRSGRMCAPARAVGRITFAAWLAERYGGGPSAL